MIATRQTLRARRPCWLVLEIDGQRLPTVTMKDGDKLNWSGQPEGRAAGRQRRRPAGVVARR